MVALVNPHAHQLRRRPALHRLLQRVCEQTIQTERSSETPEALAELLRRAKRPTAVIVAGGDATLARVADAWLDRQRMGDVDLPPLLPLRAGAVSLTARRLGVGGVRGLRRRLAKLSSKTAREVPTLRTSSAQQPRATHGFYAGFGALYQVLEESAQRGAQRRHLLSAIMMHAAQSLLAERDEVTTTFEVGPTRTTIDDAKSAWLLAPTTLAQRLELRHSAAALPLAMLSSSGLPRWIRPDAVEEIACDVLSVNVARGFFLDGELHPAGAPHALTVTPGPSVPMWIC